MSSAPKSFPPSAGQRNPDSPAALSKRVSDLERRVAALDGEAAITGTEAPGPNPQHVAAAESEAQEKSAVNYAMVSQGLIYADAVKWVKEHGGAAAVLQERDAVPVVEPAGPALQGSSKDKNSDWLSKPAKKA